MVTKKISDLPEFGKYLSSIREKAGIKTPHQAAQMTQRKKIQETKESGSFSYNQVYTDEKGLVFDIPPERLRIYAELYKVPYEEIVEKLVEEKYGVVKKTTIEDFRALVPQKQAELHEILQKILDKRKIKMVREYLLFMARGFGLQDFSEPGGGKIEEEEKIAAS